MRRSSQGGSNRGGSFLLAEWMLVGRELVIASLGREMELTDCVQTFTMVGKCEDFIFIFLLIGRFAGARTEDFRWQFNESKLM